jgi:hypothetical protein
MLVIIVCLVNVKCCSDFTLKMNLYCVCETQTAAAAEYSRRAVMDVLENRFELIFVS